MEIIAKCHYRQQDKQKSVSIQNLNMIMHKIQLLCQPYQVSARITSENPGFGELTKRSIKRSYFIIQILSVVVSSVPKNYDVI
jgi:hypothetical protein